MNIYKSITDIYNFIYYHMDFIHKRENDVE
jgi:hypothetical protein